MVNGEAVLAYRDELDVPDDSGTETFVGLRLGVANWRWQGVPFLLRTGKRMPTKQTRISVRFQGAPVSLFQASGEPCIPQEADCEARPNELIITLQPDEEFDLRFQVKAPRSTTNGTMDLDTQQLSFSYEDAFGPVPDAYETLLRDIINGDPTLFVRADEVEASWNLCEPLLKRSPPLQAYPAGTWGPDPPAARHDLSRRWDCPCVTAAVGLRPGTRFTPPRQANHVGRERCAPARTRGPPPTRP
jgi:glucose-6-phosphate 1-dehydrogenase